MWDYIQTTLVNPDKTEMDSKIGYSDAPHIIDRIPYMFLYVAAIQICFQLIAVLIVVNPPWYVPERQQKKKKKKRKKEPKVINLKNDLQESLLAEPEFEKRKSSLQKVSKEQSEYEKDSLTMQMSLRLPTFWSLWINNFLFSFALMWVVSEWKVYAMQGLNIDDDHYLAIIGSISGLCIDCFCA